MGSVREAAEVVEPKASAPAAPAVPDVPGTPAVAEQLDARGNTPSPPRGNAGEGSGLPVLDGEKQPPSPSQVAATSPAATPRGDAVGDAVVDVDANAPEERLSKKQKLEQTQDAVLELTQLVKVVLDGMSGMHDTISQSNESQCLLREEVQELARKIGHDSVTSKFFLSSLTEYQKALANVSWQLSGNKREANISVKELLEHLEDYGRDMSLKLMQFKDEQRAQHAVSVTHLKAIETAIKALTEGIRLGSQQNVAAPAGGGTGTMPAAGAPTAPGGGAATMPAGGGATPATPAGDGSALPTATVGGPLPPGPPPGYAAARGTPAAPGFPPPAPVFGSVASPSMAHPSTHRAGRLRVRNRDGTEAARAVSPSGRAPGTAEFGLGTVQYNGTLYRILPDYYLEGSFPMN